MKERPILFSGPMVRAILEGRKTQTRRVAKFVAREPGLNFKATSLRSGHYCTGSPKSGFVLRSMGGSCWNDRTHPLQSPYGLSGDRLWVRETFAQAASLGSVLPGGGNDSPSLSRLKIHYVADGQIPEGRPEGWGFWRKRPSIFMPRYASRLTLEVASVRVERVQEISEADAIAEGCEKTGHAATTTHKSAFSQLWASINGKREGCAWADNPWVWCVEFRRIA